MDINSAVEILKNDIKDSWNTTRRVPRNTIKRGHTRSLSTDVEDYVAAFISDILGEGYDLYVDSSVRIEKTHRPDLLVVKNGKAVALIEIKSQMGWCRDARRVIDDEILRMHNAFIDKGTITCKFSTDNSSVQVQYDGNVKCFLVPLTSQNGGTAEQMKMNQEYAEKQGISFQVLFDGWYDGLIDRDIRRFAEMILEMKENSKENHLLK